MSLDGASNFPVGAGVGGNHEISLFLKHREISHGTTFGSSKTTPATAGSSAARPNACTAGRTLVFHRGFATRLRRTRGCNSCNSWASQQYQQEARNRRTGGQGHHTLPEGQRRGLRLDQGRLGGVGEDDTGRPPRIGGGGGGGTKGRAQAPATRCDIHQSQCQRTRRSRQDARRGGRCAFHALAATALDSTLGCTPSPGYK